MNYSNLMEAVNARIKANGRREITGDILNDVLRAMVVELGAGYQLGGTIRPGDKPKDEDLRVAYLAVEPGMYLYAGGFEVTELSLITYGAEWYMYPLGVPFGSQIAEDIAAAVEAEKTRAMAAEKALSDAIATERGARAAADSALDSAIKAETKRATDAEGVLTKAVDDEKTRAMSAEAANAAAIASEADTREQADTSLQGNITSEADAREAADEALASKVTAEETARKAADATLQANINTEESERKAADTALGTRVTNIEDKIPAQASSENKLADKDFVNSSIATSTATFRGTFETLEALKAAQADKNDYAFWVHKDEDGNTCYDKYTYTGTEWKFEYRLNNSSFTAAQWAALNSGVTADVIKALQDADKANAKAIADEKAERIAAVAAEKTAREQADTANAEAISAEQQARTQADTALRGNITAEADAREQADTANAEAITTETAERKAADQTLQGNIDKKQDIIRDLATIRTNAENGQTAFGWGDHAKAGYTKAFIIHISGDGSTENPYAVDKTREEVAAALAANSLILLKSDAADFPGYFEIYSLNWATNYPTQALMLQFGNIDEASLIYATIVLVFSYQEGVSVSVMASSTKLATDEQVKAKQDTLVSGTNIKTINGESVLGAGNIKVGVPTMQAGTGHQAEVFNGNSPSAASGPFSHAEGSGQASGYSSHAEGRGEANGEMSHAEGESYAIGNNSHAEGFSCSAERRNSHAEGYACIARGENSHAEGRSTVAKRQNSHAEGSFNIQDDAAIHSVGIGTAAGSKDAHRINYDGKHYILGIGGFDGTKTTANLDPIVKDLATVINEYGTRIAALETALASIKSN